MSASTADGQYGESVPPPLPLGRRLGRLAELLVLVFMWMVVLGGAWVLFSTDMDSMGGVLPQCHFRGLTGYYCPGCGTTRALYALSNFDFREALGYNIMTLPFLFFLIFVLCWHTAVCIWGVKPFRLPSSPYLGYGILVFMLLFTVLRNLPWWPFTMLAP